MNIWNDDRVVLTLDAGGTNFVFSAIKAGTEIIKPVRKPSNAHHLDSCLETIVNGFQEVKKMLAEKPVAISFCIGTYMHALKEIDHNLEYKIENKFIFSPKN